MFYMFGSISKLLYAVLATPILAVATFCLLWMVTTAAIFKVFGMDKNDVFENKLCEVVSGLYDVWEELFKL